jgi:hypothetical protein
MWFFDQVAWGEWGEDSGGEVWECELSGVVGFARVIMGLWLRIPSGSLLEIVYSDAT